MTKAIPIEKLTEGPWDVDYYDGHVSFAIPAVKEDYAFRVEFHKSIEEDERNDHAARAAISRMIADAPGTAKERDELRVQNRALLAALENTENYMVVTGHNDGRSYKDLCKTILSAGGVLTGTPEWEAQQRVHQSASADHKPPRTTSPGRGGM